jgi:hypothetical protein
LQAASLHTITIEPRHYAIKIIFLEKVVGRDKKINHVLLGRRAKTNLDGKWDYDILLTTI